MTASSTASASVSAADTILGRLIAALRDKAGPLDGHERPAAVLWPDPDEEWRPLVGTLRERLPEFLALGAYDEAARRPRCRPLPAGQVWAVGPGTGEIGAGLYRIEVVIGPGSGAKILNHPVPPAFRESVKVGEQNLYRAAKQLVGNHDPRGFEYSVQLRPFDADRSGVGLGMPVSARRALNDLPDDLWTKVNIEYYSDPVDGVFKALLP